MKNDNKDGAYIDAELKATQYTTIDQPSSTLASIVPVRQIYLDSEISESKSSFFKTEVNMLKKAVIILSGLTAVPTSLKMAICPFNLGARNLLKMGVVPLESMPPHVRNCHVAKHNKSQTTIRGLLAKQILPPAKKYGGMGWVRLESRSVIR